MTTGARTELIRAGRMLTVGILAQPAIASLISSTAVRYPLVAAIMTAVEILCSVATAPVDTVKPNPPASPTPPSSGP